MSSCCPHGPGNHGIKSVKSHDVEGVTVLDHLSGDVKEIWSLTPRLHVNTNKRCQKVSVDVSKCFRHPLCENWFKQSQ